MTQFLPGVMRHASGNRDRNSQFLEIAIRNVIRAPVRNGIELETVGELHLRIWFPGSGIKRTTPKSLRPVLDKPFGPCRRGARVTVFPTGDPWSMSKCPTSFASSRAEWSSVGRWIVEEFYVLSR